MCPTPRLPSQPVYGSNDWYWVYGKNSADTVRTDAAHIVELSVQPQDIDAYGHVNNSVYLTWLDQAAWAHSAALGVPLTQCMSSRRGMAAQRIEIDYLSGRDELTTRRVDPEVVFFATGIISFIHPGSITALWRLISATPASFCPLTYLFK
jgi:hypothetical protein